MNNVAIAAVSLVIGFVTGAITTTAAVIRLLDKAIEEGEKEHGMD